MTTLAQTYVHLRPFSSRKGVLEAIADTLERPALEKARELYGAEVSLEILVAEGSLKAWVTVGGLIFGAVATYGSFRSGVDQLVNDARHLSTYLSAEVQQRTDVLPEFVYRIERRLGVPGRLQRFFRKLDSIDFESDAAGSELDNVRNELLAILRALDSEQDRQLLLGTVPDPVRVLAPQLLPGRKIAPLPSGHPEIEERRREIRRFHGSVGKRK